MTRTVSLKRTIAVVMVLNFSVWLCLFLLFFQTTQARYKQNSEVIHTYMNSAVSRDINRIVASSTALTDTLAKNEQIGLFMKSGFQSYMTDIRTLSVVAMAEQSYLEDVIFVTLEKKAYSIKGNDFFIQEVLDQESNMRTDDCFKVDEAKYYTNTRAVYAAPFYEKVGYITLVFNDSFFRSTIDSAMQNFDGQYILKKNNGEILYASLENEDLFAQTVDRKIEFSDGQRLKVKIDAKDYYVEKLSISSSNLVLYSCLSVEDAEDGLFGPFRYIITAMTISLVIAFIGLMIIFYFYKHSSQVIHKQVEDIKLGQYTASQPVPIRVKEFQGISQDIQTMADMISKLSRENLLYEKNLLEKELLTKQISLNALRNQLNPHFLYNTLGCMKSLAIINGQEEVSEMCACMAKILRYTLNDQDTALISEEIEAIQAYLYIQSIRFRGHFSYKIMVEDFIKKYSVLRFILQPIVENAIIHGIEPKRTQGKILISGYVRDEQIVFEINDTGMGIPPYILAQLQKRLKQTEAMPSDLTEKGFGIGLNNINSRIKLFYGSQYGIELNSIVNMGTFITIRVPIIEKEDGAVDTHNTD